MHSEKKITKEDTWRSDELIKHIQRQDEESRRRERLKREETHRKQRSGESTDRRPRDGERDERRERAKHREPERDGEEDRRRREERERRRERERDGERRVDRDEKENRDREKERQRERYKDRDREREGGDSGRYEEREREKERERHRDGDREREKRHRLKESEREKVKEKERTREKDREREKEREREKRKAEEKERDTDKDRDRERERRRAEREKERRKEKQESRDDRIKEQERRERHREREERHRDERLERREREKWEKEDRRENAGHTDREERRERRRREKERYEAGERIHNDGRETERQLRHQDHKGERVRDREERDKQREKRHEESKKSDSDRRREKSDSKHRKTGQEVSSKKPESAWRSNKEELSDPEIPVENEDNNETAEDYGNDDYEEDFEDYEEDFEEVEEDEEKRGEEDEDEEREGKRELSPRRREEIEAIQRAMHQENEMVSSAHSQPSTRKAEPAQRESRLKEGQTHGRVIDFAAARQREVTQQAADKQKKRSAELLRLIDLDFSVTMCLLDLPPVSEYDMYIKSFGMANTKQAYVQCNEDNTDRDTQTEETDTSDKWTQHPPETSIACGGPKGSQDASNESEVRMNVDSRRLTTFLRSAAQVMAVLLEEDRAESNSVKKLHSQTDSLSFSDGCLHLNTKLPFLYGRQVTLLHFSQVQTHTLLSVHAPCSGSSGVRLDSKTILCVWNIWEPSAPQRILIYEAEVRCCCFSPGKATLVFAGTAVGSVVLWDLREHSGSHLSLRVGEEEWTLRYPTFSTDAVLSGAGHFSSVVSVEPVLVNVEPGFRGPLLADQEESLGLSFQLGSLDESGLLNLWVVIELAKPDDSGSQTDLGLRPGGKVKLLHSSSIQTSERSSLLLKFLPSDSNHYFIGTNMGVVRRGARHGLRVVPKLYRPENGERPAEVTALDFCPSGEPFFLVGCSDGTLRLHSVQREEPVLEWSSGSGAGDVPVLSVLWSRTRPTVFCVLDGASVLHIWDLAERDLSPVFTENLHTDRVTAMAVFGEAARQNRYSGIALAKQSGRLEIQFLKQSLTVPQPSDTEKLHLLVQDNL